MDLLLLFIVGIVISEYTEKRSKFINIVNSVVFIVLCVLVFYGSNNSIVSYAAQNTMDATLYTNIHTALRISFYIGSVTYSSYSALLFILSMLSIIIATLFTVKVVKNIIKLSKKKKLNPIVEKKYKFSLINNGNRFNKLYLVFGGFLS